MKMSIRRLERQNGLHAADQDRPAECNGLIKLEGFFMNAPLAFTELEATVKQSKVSGDSGAALSRS